MKITGYTGSRGRSPSPRVSASHYAAAFSHGHRGPLRPLAERIFAIPPLDQERLTWDSGWRSSGKPPVSQLPSVVETARGSPAEQVTWTMTSDLPFLNFTEAPGAGPRLTPSAR